jgi:hypothetical protein
VLTIDEDDDAPMGTFRFAKGLYERIIEAQNLAFMNEIKANTVVINGRKYGMLKDEPGFVPTIFGMKAETKAAMPDEWDFFLQERPPQPKTNADRLRSMTDEELATFLVQTMTCTACRDMHGGECPKPKDYKEKKCSDMILDWLKEEAEDGSDNRQSL